MKRARRHKTVTQPVGINQKACGHKLKDPQKGTGHLKLELLNKGSGARRSQPTNPKKSEGSLDDWRRYTTEARKLW